MGGDADRFIYCSRNIIKQKITTFRPMFNMR